MTVETATTPEIDIDVSAEDSWEILAALHGPNSFSERWRTITLAGCKEAIRAQMALDGVKVTEERLKDLCHLHPKYLSFLTTHLLSRIKYERAFVEKGGLR